MSESIPTCADLASDPLVHRYDDLFNPPGLTNFLGCAQVDHDVLALRSVNFPPYSQSDTVTGQLYVDGRLARSFGAPVTVTWRPDRVVRETVLDELELRTVTACPPGTRGVVVDLRVRNRGTAARTVRLGLALDSTVTRSARPWLAAEPPREGNELRVAGSVVVGAARESEAVAVQGIDRPAVSVAPRRIEVELTIAPDAVERVGYVHVLGADSAEAHADFERLVADVPAAIEAATAEWDAELAAAFTPGNDRFSGCLPQLHTDNAALRKLYWMGALGVIWFRRDNPVSVLGRVYDTLMPRYWQTTTFIWDYTLSSIVHALLDPAVMRRQVAHWTSLDIHTHFGTEWQHGGPVGYWYAVNDYAMTRLVRDYVRFSGDAGLLDEQLAAASGATKPVAEHVVDWARAWQGLRGKHGLADYGEMDNLLECVSSYTHEVASFNATNVWALRAAAELVTGRGGAGSAEELRAEADELAARVLELYVEGGYWRAGQPDGVLQPVGHCLDFANVAMAMHADLTAQQRSEMVQFFVRELQTPTWMRALSPYDPDATFSLRPDHQWNGAYTAWPADAARALYDLGRGDLAAAWLDGLARSANQGPFGQAHFTTEAAPDVNGGARKAPPQAPYLIDWACSSSGAFVGLVLESVFGLRVPVDGEPTATPALSDIDPGARLSGLVIKGRRYSVTAVGLQPEPVDA
jgi:hypothetical protein